MMKLATILTLSSLWLAVLAAVGQKPAPPRASKPVVPATLQTIEHSIARIGGRATLLKYFDPQDETPQANAQMTRVESGDKAWVAMGVRMLPYSDASSTLGLLYSLGIAMQKQPRNVLPYVGKGDNLTPQDICLPPIWEDNPLDENLALMRRSRAAILTVKDKALARQCQICLTEINDLEKIMLNNAARAAAKGKKK